MAEINEKHLGPWATLCSTGGLENTPLSPYLDQQLIHRAHINLDGSKIRSEGFTFSVPKPTQSNLLEVNILTFYFINMYRTCNSYDGTNVLYWYLYDDFIVYSNLVLVDSLLVLKIYLAESEIKYSFCFLDIGGRGKNACHITSSIPSNPPMVISNII